MQRLKGMVCFLAKRLPGDHSDQVVIRDLLPELFYRAVSNSRADDLITGYKVIRLEYSVHLATLHQGLEFRLSASGLPPPHAITYTPSPIEKPSRDLVRKSPQVMRRGTRLRLYQ